MKLITIRTQIRDVAERWRERYSSRAYQNHESFQEIQRALDAVDKESAAASDIEAIIGNDTWVGPITCNECGNKFDAVVEVGEAPDYESNTACLCLDCARKALSIFDAV